MPARADAITCSTRCRVARFRELQASTPPFPKGGPFDLIVVDLPLRWDGWSVKGEGRSPQRHYATMDIDALIRMLRELFAAVAAKDCVSGWWVYGPRLPDTLKVIEGSGFKFTTELLVWDKPGAFGTGKTTRKVFENMWGAKRGRGIPIRNHEVSQRVVAPRAGHSVKPDEAYHALERLYGDVRRLELFARRPREGWTTWGKEV